MPKILTTDQKREAVEVMCEATGLLQRRACRLAGLSLSTCRYLAQYPASDEQLSLRITELALERRRSGYRRNWQLLRREGLCVNHKHVHRIYCLLKLNLRPKGKRFLTRRNQAPLVSLKRPIKVGWLILSKQHWKDRV